MTVKLDQVEITAELGKLFRKITFAECQLVRQCLQSVADERNNALGRVEVLEAEVAAWKEGSLLKGGPDGDPGGVTPVGLRKYMERILQALDSSCLRVTQLERWEERGQLAEARVDELKGRLVEAGIRREVESLTGKLELERLEGRLDGKGGLGD